MHALTLRLSTTLQWLCIRNLKSTHLLRKWARKKERTWADRHLAVDLCTIYWFTPARIRSAQNKGEVHFFTIESEKKVKYFGYPLLIKSILDTYGIKLQSAPMEDALLSLFGWFECGLEPLSYAICLGPPPLYSVTKLKTKRRKTG